ncbi:hypothetical protein EV697_101414 [Bisgaardia hudsonensis]|uniref:ATP-binding protein n=1 Tax=Bisgaardia hudsonensis TaxID=109472 RepID=A0A4R2N370_9PAST|nr:ATP-binding protein [Bisgaardia hudsonensis]QLB12724.1 hypothetical protein A6A11_03445 [Bisgaardia hudsonensis]TCP14275.1 hypothetical protein EV697_101414 [Bisgaardia hudsonensis]
MVDWKNIKSYESSQNTAFEEVVCQLAYNENKENGKYIRVKAPDGGVESYLILDNGDEIGWQAKYFFDIQDSQFTQIKKSFETAITKHPKLKKYYVCCPIDKQDPRISGKNYLQDRWKAFVENCEIVALDKGISVKVEWWGAFELNNKLQKPENVGMVQYWFGGDNFSDSWFSEQVTTSIRNLGPRFTPELNVEIHGVNQYFDAVLKNDQARTYILKKLNSFYKASQEVKESYNKYDSDIEDSFNNLLNCLENSWQHISMQGTDSIQLDNTGGISFKEIGVLSKKLVSEISRLVDTIQSNTDKNKIQQDLYKLRDAIDDFESDLQVFSLFNNPCLIVYGDAGIGKSHLLGDFSNRLIKEKKTGIFILGQTLTASTNPWTQILKDELRLNCNEDVFLGVLNTIGHAQRERVPVVIDALNEGAGRLFWENTLAGFIEKFKKYPWVALVLSVRSEYRAGILTNIQQDIKDGIVSEVHHNGFQSNVFEAVRPFFKHYQLDLPKEPLLTQEFTNPLFLKIYCEYRKHTQTDVFAMVLIEVFDHYFSSINDKLADVLGYRPALKYVQKILNKLAEEIFHRNSGGSQSIYYEDAMQVVANHTHISLNADKFLQKLIDENLLTSYKNTKEHSEILYFSYERFYDYLTAKFICDDNTTVEDLKLSLSCNQFSVMYKKRRLSQGTLSILSVFIPINFKVELFELLDKDKIYQNDSLGSAFIDGLYWRDNHNFNLEKCREYINISIVQDYNLFAQFIDLHYKVVGKENHPLNANQLHGWLSKYNLADRDSFWTTHISSEYLGKESAIHSIIDWAKKQGFSEGLNDTNRYLVGIALSWLFTSTHIKLRDNATIALTRLLQNNIHVAAQLLKTFQNIDDPYVFERILASIYGSILSSQSHQGIYEVCKFLLHDIFAKEEVYPNVLIRDFARNIIEYANSNKLVEFSENELVLARPPYRSAFPRSFPSNDDIDAKYSKDYKDINTPKYHFAQNRILRSMTTKYGRGMCNYGDFGRYIFQSRFGNWDNIDIDKLSNYAIEIIFEKFGYDVEKHGEFDLGISSSRGENRVERIGKKYQWLAMYEVVARVSDNFKMVEPSTRWNKDKKYIWYNGSIEPSFRDIDPTFILPDLKNLRMVKRPNYSDWRDDFEEWVISKDNLIDSKDIIVNIFDNEEWLSLDRYINFKPNQKLGNDEYFSSYQEMWYLVNAYLVKNEDFRTVVSNLTNKNFMGRWMPQPVERYNDIFNLEYYWSPLLNIYENDYYGSSGWQDIYERNLRLTEESLGNVYVCSENHNSEGIKNRELAYKISVPAKFLFDALNLKNDKFSGSWINQNNDLVIFDASLYGNKGGTNLVVKKNILEELEKITGCKVVWTILAEKIAMYNYSQSTKKRLQVSGVYYLENGKLIGNDYFFIN